MQKHFYTLLFVSLIILPSFSQQNSYEPIPDKVKSASRITSKMEKRFEKDVEKIPKKNRREIREAYEDRLEITTKKVLEGHFIFEDSINQYFNNILYSILEKNPDIPHKKDIQLFLSRYYWPNASCVGEGTLIFNIGLLRRLENESQVAFVIAHELAHYALDHVNHAMQKRIQKLNSYEAKKAFRAIKNDQINAGRNASELLKEFVFDDRKHSRTFESSADSLAIIYLQKTSYDLNEGIRTLEILDNIDKEKYQLDLNIKKRFDSPDYKFRSSWLMKEEGLSMKKKDDFELDSALIKTHPECQTRITALNRIIPSEYKSDKQNIQTSIAFDELVRIADFEMVSSSFIMGDYGRSLFYCLQLLEQHPDNAWLHAMVGITMYDIYVSQQEHVLGRYVDLPSKKYKEDYRELMQFIHNLRLKNIGNISYFYMQKNKEKYIENEHYLYGLMLVSDLVDEEEQVQKYKKEYLNKFPKGRYRTHVRDF